MRQKIRRVVVAVLTGLPGLGLALIAKPLNLGEGVMNVGLLLSIALPLVTLFMFSPRRDEPL